MIKKWYLAAATALWVVAPALAPAAAAPSRAAAAPPVAASDLPSDPAVRAGVLPNGMHYRIMRNATPPRNASLRLRIDAGSMYETDDQRGLAHFIEHMVLNGPKNVPEGEFVRRLERAGLKFGPDTNARTEFEQTVYMLDLPETDAATVDTALFLLREVAGEATLAPSAIDSERGIILSEERTRATPQYRAALDQYGYLLRGDLLPSRFPIGSTEVIRAAQRDRFARFYDAYYRPERATLIAVGDFDPEAMEAKIRAQFGTWKGRGKPGPELPAAKLGARKSEAHVFVEPGVGTQVSVNWVRPHDSRPDSKAVEQQKMIELLGLQIINRRLERIASSSANPPFIGAGAGRNDFAKRGEVVSIVAATQPGQWQAGLAAIDQEQRRAAQFGFAQAELDREVQAIRAALGAAAAGAATRTSPVLAEGLVKAVNDQDVFTTPAFDLSLFEETVRGLTADKVAQATRQLFSGAGPLLYLTSPAPVEGGDTALLAAYAADQKSAVAATEFQQAKDWPYQSFGTPGTVAERHELDGLGATAIRFQNGVRLTVKPTDFRKDEVLVSVRIGDGLLDLPADRPNPSWALNAGALVLGGPAKITYEDLQQVLSSKVYGVAFGIGEDAFVLNGKTRPQDFATQLQVLAAYVSDPSWRASGWDRLRAYSGTIQDQLATTPGGVFARDAGVLLHSGDSRWATPTREQMATSKIDEGKALLAAPFASGPMEIVIVGDISVDEAVRQVAATFGALPPRGAPTIAATAKTANFPAGGLVRRTHKGRADQGLAFVAWPTNGFYADQKRTRTLNLLGNVLELRLIDEIREKQGTTYSPDATHSASQTFPSYGYLAAQIEAPPEKLDPFLADVAKIAASIRDTPVTADELQRARKPLIENIQRQRASNEWWLTQLANAQTNPGVSESIREGIAQYEALTPADIQQAARQYLVDAKAWKMEIVPEAAATAAPKP
jgi:zinc protease